MRTKVILIASLIVLFAAASVYGQLTLKAKIDFPFTVEGKVLPAGDYDFVRTDMGEAFRVVSGGKNVALAAVLTRLAGEMHTTPQDAHIVFDVVGGTHLLSEIWMPDEDGYVLLTTKEAHKHKVINVKR